MFYIVSVLQPHLFHVLDGVLKMYDVYYYEQINAADVVESIPDAQTKEACADRCVAIGCDAFDVTPNGQSFICDFAMAGYTTVEIKNDAGRTFNHFKADIKRMKLETLEYFSVHLLDVT